MSQDLINRAVRGLKRCGPFYYRPGDEPHPLDRSLAGRVKHVFLCGMTRAIQICRDAGEDPDYEEPKPPSCFECGAEAIHRGEREEWFCNDCLRD